MKTVPKELTKEVIDLYCNKKYGIHKIATLIGNSDYSVINTLKENDVAIRNLKEAAVIVGKNKFMEVDRQTQNDIIELYKQGYGLNKIIEKLHLDFSFDKVKKILNENNIHVRGVAEAHKSDKIEWNRRKYFINDNYDFESHNGAWIVGLFAADGNLPDSRGAKNRVTISLAKKDADCLELIKNELEYEGNVRQYVTSNGFDAVCLAFTSAPIRKKMENYGVVPDKTYKMHHLPDSMPQEYMLDYIRGYFDGDGSVWVNKNKYGGKVGMSFTCHSKTFIDEIQQFLHDNYNLTERHISKDHSNWSIAYGKKESFILGKLFYNNSYLALPRKKNKFFMLQEQYPLLR